MNWQKLYNPIMKFILSSPLHPIVSNMYMLITFTGRKTGKVYTTPVEYFFDGETLMFFTNSTRVWWRNLQDDANVTVRVKGQEMHGYANTVTGDAEAFAEAFRAYLVRYPGREKYFKVRIDENGKHKAEDMAEAAQRSVAVKIKLG